MTPAEFIEGVNARFREGTPEALLAFAAAHMDSVSPPLTSREYAAVAGGPLEWAQMCVTAAREAAANEAAASDS